MGKTKKTGNLVNVVVTDNDNNVTLPKALTLGEQPLLTDDSLKVPTTSWVNDKVEDKVDKVTGKGLSTNDFTDTLKTKLDGIAAGAEVNVNADWDAVSGDAQILNKPTIPSIAGLATEAYVDAKVEDTIVDGVITKAPSQNAVFDALALKANTSQLHNPVTLGTANGLSLATQVLSLGLASSSANGALSSTDWATFNAKQNALALTVTGNSGAATLVGSTLNIPTYTLAGLGGQVALNGTGFVKISGTTISYDNSTYLTTISGITAGGELSGSYPNPTLVNSAVTGKVLSGLNVTGSSIQSTDTILSAFGKLQNQVNSLLGSSIYQGTWNASTNTPTLTSSVGTKGHYYIVSVAGTTNLNGITNWNIGDWAIYSGTAWQRVDNTGSVTSVNGFTGAVNLTTSNITEGTNLYYTNGRTIASVLTGYVSGTGTISATDTILQAIQKLNGNIGALTTTNVTEGTRLYYTDTRARAAISAGTGITYNNTTGVITNNITQYTDALARAAISLTTTGTSGAATYNSTTGVLNVPQYTPDLSGFVPYTGATANVNLGTHTLLAKDLVINHSSGSGVAASITKNGSGEALTVVKGSGSGNAASITGGITLLTTLNLTNALADSFIASAATWNAKENAITAGTNLQYFRGDKTFQTLNTSVVPEGTNLYYTEARVNANTNVAANTAARHNAVTIGTGNGLSLSTQVLSLGLASGSAHGALSSTDWTTFNNKQNSLTLTVTGNSGAATLVGSTLNIPTYTLAGLGGQSQLNGTGFVRASGTTITYDNSTYLTTINGINAGGELAGTYPNPTLVNSAVTGKVLTGVNITGGSIVATDTMLTAFGKIQNQINGLIGGSIYQGTWNANTNSPSLTSSVGTNGHYYIVSVAGSTNLNGITDWKVGDWAIFAGTTWQKVDNTDAVVSVNGFTGAVSLTTDNISEGSSNLYFTNARARGAISAGAGIGYNSSTGVISSTITQYTDALARGAISLTVNNNSGAATYNSSTGVLNIPTYTLAGLGGQPLLTNPITGTGTTNFLPKFTGGSTLGNSALQEVNGNLGLGVTPSAWNTGINAIDINTKGAIASGSGSDIVLWGNSLYNTSFQLVYKTSAAASYYEQFSGNHIWYTAPSGTAGNVITFTQAMTLGANGNLLLGTTTDNGARLQVSGGNLTVSDSTSPRISVSGNSSSGFPGYSLRNTTQEYEMIVRGNISNAFQIRNSTAATDLITITAGGNVGIGTTSPAERLSINGNAQVDEIFIGVTTGFLSGTTNAQIGWAGGFSGLTNGSLILQSRSNVATPIIFATETTEKMRINGNGNVGIGTTAPSERLHVVGNGLFSGGARFFSGLNYMEFLQNVFTSQSNDGAHIRSVVSVNEAPTYSWAGDTDTGMYTPAANTIGFSTGGSEKMRITSSGNVGIGTTSPFNKLTVAGFPANGYGLITISSDWASGSAISTGIKIGAAADAGGAGVDIRSHSNYANTAETQMSFWTNSTSSVITERMRITSGGNVGIGTTSPDYRLSINGSSAFGASAAIGNPTNDFSIFRGISVSDGTGSFGSYGGFILNSNNQYSSSAKRFLITNALDATKFAIIRSTDTNTNPSIGVAGVVSSGIADFVINSLGNVGIGTTAPTQRLDVNGNVLATSFIRSGGTSSQFLKADGSVDSSTYLTGITSSQVTTALGFTPYNATNPSGYITSSASITGSAATLTTARTLTVGNTGKTFNGGANVSWSLNEIGAVASSQADTTVWRGTQAQYDAIGTKSSTTLYFIN
jgi:hypothetical protein